MPEQATELLAMASECFVSSTFLTASVPQCRFSIILPPIILPFRFPAATIRNPKSAVRNGWT